MPLFQFKTEAEIIQAALAAAHASAVYQTEQPQHLPQYKCRKVAHSASVSPNTRPSLVKSFDFPK